ncbi:hypothetical protein [Hufsiella ginkgonis]|uniref:Uncharacterized protein n=1 Tax=Hufsiella ginkgonis TaxID=2695274 RepID=A0A7K1Y4F7_9SPHI|nr:hypothetical protein [Hufsiella ginkgonis]MXV17596.1 hypothetical protein [Hufsiella ginkgonis]
MKNLLVIMFFMLTGVCAAFSQETEYYEVDGKQVSKGEFLIAARKPGMIEGYLAANGRKEYRVFGSSGRGVKPADSLVMLRNYLQLISKTVIPSDEVLLIEYYPGVDPCNKHFEEPGRMKDFVIRDENYYQMLVKGYKNVSRFNICESFDGLKYLRKVKTYYPDTEQLVKKLFFNYHFPCGSFVVIKPDGSYYAHYGEYPRIHVAKIISEMATVK